jgi:hypothetical protein
MLTVTAAALDRLSKKLAGKKANDDEAFRFTRRARGWKLRLDCARPADMAFSHNGQSVLLLDAGVSQAMRNMTLDVRSTDSGPRLKLSGLMGSKD